MTAREIFEDFCVESFECPNNNLEPKQPICQEHINKALQALQDIMPKKWKPDPIEGLSNIGKGYNQAIDDVMEKLK